MNNERCGVNSIIHNNHATYIGCYTQCVRNLALSNNSYHPNKMAVPSYDELLARWNVENSIMQQTCSDHHLRELSLTLDRWETLAKFLMIPASETGDIKRLGDVGTQGVRVLECWKQRCGSAATYKVLVKTLLQISRTDLAEIVVVLRLSSSDAHTTAITINQSQPSPSPGESSLVIHPSPANNNGIEDMSSPATMSSSVSLSPLSQTIQCAHMVQEELISSLKELEDEFYDIVSFTEVTLKKNEVNLETIIRRFSMLPQSIKKQYQADENYTTTRWRILNSTTIKQLFDNLTELKHWSYMTPDALAHILQDVKIDDVHQKIEKYKSKLTAFKTKTKLRDIIDLSFPVPDYCIELTMKFEGWEDKTIEEAEKAAMKILQRATYSDREIRIGLKRVNPGCIELVFILLESIDLYTHFLERLPEVCKGNGVIKIQVDGDDVYCDDNTILKVKL